MGVKELSKKYEDIMHKRLLETYLNEENVVQKELFEDADLYDMKESEVDIFCANFQKATKRCEEYIKRILEKNGSYRLFSYEWNIFCDYGKTLGFSAEEVGLIFQKYMEENNNYEKEELLKIFYEVYANKWEIDEEIVEDLELSDEEQEEVQKIFDSNFAKFSKLVEIEYQNSKDSVFLNDDQIAKLKDELYKIFRFETNEDETRNFCILRTPTDGFAEQNGRVAERADCLNYS